MTQSYPHNADHSSPATGNGTGGGAGPAGSDVAGLLDQVCGNVARFLAGAPRPPRNLRVRAGEVSVDIEWDAEWPEPHRAPVGGPAGSELAPAAGPGADPEPSGGYLVAQTVGVFYRAPEPGAAPFVREGDTVILGQQIGIIEAMKLMIPVEADRAGRISAVLKDNAEPVEYGDRLFALTSVNTA